MRYIGGKSLLVNDIMKIIQGETSSVRSVIDVFAGSGVVSAALARAGYGVWSNDALFFSYCLVRGTVGLSELPAFRRLGFDAIERLNSLTLDDTSFKQEQCFVLNNYAPHDGCERMYFKSDNALKIDIVRMQIERWKADGLLTEDEYFYLLAVLLNAVPYVANITGIYAAYLKFWDKRANNALWLKPLDVISCGSKCTNLDCSEVVSGDYDLLYADPPYNSRDYLSNYHVLETIARYDYPRIHGVTGIRASESRKSKFCGKRTAVGAFEELVRDCQCKYVLISYNNEGIVKAKTLSEICRTYAAEDSFRLIEIDYRRYKNKIPNNRPGLKEQLYLLRRH